MVEHPLESDDGEPTPAPDHHTVRVTFDPKSKRWGFYPSHQFDRREAEFEELVGQEYPFNTVEAATMGAMKYLEPYWHVGSTSWIVGGVVVPNIPPSVHVIGSPGYRARIDAGLYDLNQEQLQHVHAQTEDQFRAQTRLSTINYEIPVGQQVHAFCLLWEKLPRQSRPKMNDFLDQMMPKLSRRTRQRHLRAFLIVSSEDWPLIVRFTEVEITGLGSILEAARIYAGPNPPKRKSTPMKQRYMELRNLVYTRRYDDARRLVLRFDEEDDDVQEGTYADEHTQ
jgi:hypothetical protein